MWGLFTIDFLLHAIITCPSAIVAETSTIGTICPGQKPPVSAVKRPVRPNKNAIQHRLTLENAKGAYPPPPGWARTETMKSCSPGVHRVRRVRGVKTMVKTRGRWPPNSTLRIVRKEVRRCSGGQKHP
jgi:hypothetical protein